MVYLFLGAVFFGLLFVGLGIPLALGKVPPNRLYGFRTKRTLADAGLWYAANRFLGLAIIIAGMVTVVGTLILFLVGGGLTLIEAAVLLSVIALVPLLGSIVAALVYYWRA